MNKILEKNSDYPQVIIGRGQRPLREEYEIRQNDIVFYP
jgi:hypothetical protein